MKATKMMRTSRELWGAHENWERALRKLPLHLRRVFGSFYGFLQDVPAKTSDLHGCYVVNEEAARRIDMLNGPNADIMVRIHAIQTLEEKSPSVKHHHKAEAR